MKNLYFYVALSLLGAGTCSAQDLTLSKEITSGKERKKTATKITATNVIRKDAAAIYQAGNLIQLKSGFQATKGSVFRAFIKGGETTAKAIKQESEIESTTIFELKAYPNPNNGMFKVGLGNLQEGTIQIVDLLSRTVYQSDFKNQKEFDINMQDNPAGIYLVKVNSKDQVYTSKIIKN